MTTTLYQKNKKYAEQLLADLQTREANGEFDGNRNTEWARKYNALETAIVDLARTIGGEYSISDLPELADIFGTVAAFAYGSVSAYYTNDDGDCALSEATEVHISASDCNADYYQAPCAHTCMGDTIIQYIVDALDPREFCESAYREHQSQLDEATLYPAK